MNIKTVIIFGATGMQGQPQIVEALRQGYKVKAASRNPSAFANPKLKAVAAVRADYDDPASLDAVLVGVDAILLQVPAMGNLPQLLRQCENLMSAVKRSSVQLLVFNSSMWAPDEPCGDPTFDGVLQTEEVFRRANLPVIVFRPTVFMDNLLTPFMKPMLTNEGLYRYAHQADLASDWICHDDLAKFMVAALKRPDLIGKKIHIGGPERLTTLQVVDIISQTAGTPIRYEHITPRQLGERFYALTAAGQGTGGDISSISREHFIDAFDHFYTFVNTSPLRPFQANVQTALGLIPVPLTNMRTWAKAQDWSAGTRWRKAS